MPQLSQQALEKLRQVQQGFENASNPQLPASLAPDTGEDPESAKARAIRMMQIKQKLDAMHDAEDASLAQNGPTLSANPQAAALASQVPAVMTSDQQPSSDSGTFQSDIDKVKRAYLAKLAAGGQ